MGIHRQRGRPRADEDATTHRATVRIPLPLWAEIERLAAEDGITPHAWMRQALESATSSRPDDVPRP